MSDPVILTVGPRNRDLLGLTVNRVWPTARRRLIGPFIFLDHMLRARLPAGSGLDVPPHPHIGLATVTYLFEGEIMHADSMGVQQAIRPGELNWMHAGSGVTHSERSTDADRGADSFIQGIQCWVALPSEYEDSEPAFAHHSAEELPSIDSPGVQMKLIAGSAFGQRAPVGTLSPLFYLEADMAAGTTLELPVSLGQRGAYIVSGSLTVAGSRYAHGQILVFDDALDVLLTAGEDSKLMLLGGQPLSGERFVWWNFVSSSADAIEMARQRWAAREFPAVPGDSEYMPLPG
jgi:redox-sensitive bicupin YhaK (pirin superfamily)